MRSPAIFGSASTRGGDVWCSSVNANVGVSGSNVTIAVAGSSSMVVRAPSGAGSNVFLRQRRVQRGDALGPDLGNLQNITVVGPLSTCTGGVTLTEGGSATIGGALYFPNGPMALSGGASIGNGADACLEIVASQITLSGGTSIKIWRSACSRGGSAAEAPVLVQ